MTRSDKLMKPIYWLFWRINKFVGVDEFKNKSFKEFLLE